MIKIALLRDSHATGTRTKTAESSDVCLIIKHGPLLSRKAYLRSASSGTVREQELEI